MNGLSIEKRLLVAAIFIIVLVGAASFAAGYLYRGQRQQAPIIIEKNSPDSLE